MNETFICPHCGEKSFIKRESVLDGWRKTGDICKCAFCGAVVDDPLKKTEDAVPDQGEEKKNALASLLGEDVPEVSVKKDFWNEEKHFCRDCQHRVINAFRIRCLKHDRDVEPMDDCPDFTKRKAE